MRIVSRVRGWRCLGEPLLMFLSSGANQQPAVKRSKSEADKTEEMTRVRRSPRDSIPTVSTAGPIIFLLLHGILRVMKCLGLLMRRSSIRVKLRRNASYRNSRMSGRGDIAQAYRYETYRSIAWRLWRSSISSPINEPFGGGVTESCNHSNLNKEI